MEGTAFFVRYPRLLSDLIKPHLASQEKPYKVVKTITLSTLDFENLINDLVADRSFIEEYSHLCHVGNDAVWNCIFVHQRGKTDGLLLMPDSTGRFVLWAAYTN